MTKCCGQESYGSGPRPGNDRRLQLIQEIKNVLGDMDNEERSRKRGGGKKTGGVQIPGVRDMEEECLQYRKRQECSAPTITSIAIHETRPTSMYDTMKYENTKQVTFVDATRSTDPWDPMPPAPWELPRTPSQELRASNLYMSCDCRKRNGLQHDCPRWDCGGRPQCLAVNPGPCCVPSKARKPVRGDRRSGGVESQGQPYLGNQSGLQQTTDNQRAQQNFPGTQISGAAGPTGTAMVCLCQPVDACKSPAAQPPALPPPRQEVNQDFVGFIAISSAGPDRRAVSPAVSNPVHGVQGSPGGPGMVCLCQSVGG